MRTDILVTGSQRFLGRAVVAALRRRDHTVTGWDLHAPPTPGSQPVDVHDRARIRALLADLKPSAVIHLAAAMDVSGQNPATLVDTNVTGTTNLLEAAREEAVRRFVYASSVMVYGPPSSTGAPVTEQAVTDPRTLYGAAKVFIEQVAQQDAYTRYLETAGLRFTTVYGPSRLRRSACPFVVDAFAAAASTEPVPINVTQAVDLIHVADAAEAVAQAPTVDGVYNIGHHEVSGQQMIDLIRQLRPHAALRPQPGAAATWPTRISCDRARNQLA